MNIVINPKVKILANGKSFTVKEMAAKAGAFMPKHLASMESILVIQQGVCLIHLENSTQTLNEGDVFIVPANLKHQIETKQDFKAIHIMPPDIVFEFFK